MKRVDGFKMILSGVVFALFFLSCNQARFCLRLTLDLSQEPFGATDINALTGNQGLTVGINQKGTITLFKYPNPSYYDQVKYMTTKRTAPNLGALENEGIFSGIYYQTDSEQGFFWLRELDSEQEYLNPYSVVVKTRFIQKELGLEIIQLDLVEPGQDVFWRHYQINHLPGSKIKNLKLIVYANFAPQVSKWAWIPLKDWCLDPASNSHLKWIESEKVFLQYKQGKDRSSKRESSVFIAFGLDSPPDSYQAGYDHNCRIKFHPKDPYLLASGGEFTNSASASGKVSAGLSTKLVFDEKARAEASLIIAVADNKDLALKLIRQAKSRGFNQALSQTQAHWQGLLKDVPLPKTTNQRIRNMSLRSVITLLLGVCRDSGAIVASASSQPPYGEDWTRDGAYINEALLRAGFLELVRQHNLFYLKVQSQPEKKVKFVPEGNWATNYYADGMPGFPFIWWEIDETGFAIWTLYRYFEESQDLSYLKEVYPAIKRAGNFLLEFRTRDGMPKKAYENDYPIKTQTIRGVLSVLLGLKYAVKSARALGDEKPIPSWEKRIKKLEKLLWEKFYDPQCGRFVNLEKEKGRCETLGAGYNQALLLWPLELVDYSSLPAEQAGEDLWKFIEPSFQGKRNSGSYEPYGILSLAKLWKNDPEKTKLLEKALLWEATVPATNTGHLGEAWIELKGKISPAEAQPQLWHQALFYLSALEIYREEKPEKSVKKITK